MSKHHHHRHRKCPNDLQEIADRFFRSCGKRCNDEKTEVLFINEGECKTFRICCR